MGKTLSLPLVPSETIKLSDSKVESIIKETMGVLLRRINELDELNKSFHPKEAKIAVFHNIIRIINKRPRKNYYHFFKNEGYE